MCYLTIIGVGFLAWLIPVLLFTRHIPYHIERELEAGTRIYEYTPGMIHVKMLVVDDLWSAIGTTNFDNRSFEHNDEVNLGVRNARIAERLTADNEADIANSQEVTLERWRQRPLWEKLIGSIAWVGVSDRPSTSPRRIEPCSKRWRHGATSGWPHQPKLRVTGVHAIRPSWG